MLLLWTGHHRRQMVEWECGLSRVNSPRVPDTLQLHHEFNERPTVLSHIQL